jgi:hypothetical protein
VILNGIILSHCRLSCFANNALFHKLKNNSAIIDKGLTTIQLYAERKFHSDSLVGELESPLEALEIVNANHLHSGNASCVCISSHLLTMLS